jgi:hypothetical protein
MVTLLRRDLLVGHFKAKSIFCPFFRCVLQIFFIEKYLVNR